MLHYKLRFSILTALFIGALGFCPPVFSAAWDDYFTNNEFVKMIVCDPTFALREGFPTAGTIDNSEYQMIDNLGINLIYSGIRYNWGDQYRAVLDPNINLGIAGSISYIPVLLGSSVRGWSTDLSESEGLLQKYAVSIAVEQQLGAWIYAKWNWNGEKDTKGIERNNWSDKVQAIWALDDYDKVGHNEDVLKALPQAGLSGATADERTFGGTSMPDFYDAWNLGVSNTDFWSSLVSPRFPTGDKYRERPLYFYIRLRLDDQYPGSTFNENDTNPLLEVRIYESNTSDLDETYSFSIAALADSFDITQDSEFEEYHWLKIKHNATYRPELVYTPYEPNTLNPHTLQLQLRLSYTGSNPSAGVFIDSLRYYDDIGLFLAGDYYHNYDAFNDDNTISNYTFAKYEIWNCLNDVYSLFSNHAAEAIVDWDFCEPNEHSMLNSVLVDKIVQEHTTHSHRLNTDRPWGHNEWLTNNETNSWQKTQNQGKRNYAHALIDSMINESGVPQVIIAQHYPYIEGKHETNAESIQSALDDLIGNDDLSYYYSSQSSDDLEHQKYLLYLDYLQKTYGVKPIIHIQCMYDQFGSNPDQFHRDVQNGGEIAVQAYLALAYGIKGIGYYLFCSDDDGKPYGIYTGDGFSQWDRNKCGDNVTYKDDVITEVNNDIDLLTPYLYNMEYAEGGCYKDGSDPNVGPIDGIVWLNSAVHYTEVCNFTTVDPLKMPAGQYFMVVNRDAYSTQSIVLQFNSGSTNNFIEDMATHSINQFAIDPEYGLSVPIALAPGKGKLFRLSSFDDQQGTKYSWQGEVRISGDFELTRNLTIAPGCTVRLYDNGSITIPDGHDLIAEGSGISPIIFLPGFHNKTAKVGNAYWGGIKLYNNSGATHFSHCSFIHAENGVDVIGITGTTPQYLVENSSFNNCFNGIRICQQSDNIRINNCDFIDNQSIGILVGDLGESPSYAEISNCNFSRNPLVSIDCGVEFRSSSGCILSSNFTNLNGVSVYLNRCINQLIEIENSSFILENSGPGYAIKSYECTNSTINVSGNLQGLNTFEGYSTAISLNTTNIHLSGITMCEMSPQPSNYIQIFNNGFLNISGSIIDAGNDAYNTVISANNCNISLNNSIITSSGTGIYLDSDGSNIVEVSGSSIIGSVNPIANSFGIKIFDATLKLYGKYNDEPTVEGFETGVYCDGCLVKFDKTPASTQTIYCVIQGNKNYGAQLYGCQAGSKIAYTKFIENGDISNVQSCGGIYLNNSSPKFTINFFQGNIGPAVIADNHSSPALGVLGANTLGNEFTDNLDAIATPPAIIYEVNNSYSDLKQRYNNLYLGALSYYIYNTSQQSSRNVENNYWGTSSAPSNTNFIPGAGYWDWDPSCSAPNNIGGEPDNLIGGGGDLLSIGLDFESIGDFDSAVDSYEQVFEESNNLIDRQIALGRILPASTAGNMNLQPLLGYYQSIMSIGNGSIVSYDDSVLSETAFKLRAKVKQQLNNYNSAIMDYEDILANNPTLEDSVYAVIEAGYSYLKKKNTPQGNGFGQGNGSSLGGPIQFNPQFPELEPSSWEEFMTLRMELVELVLSTNAGTCGSGTGNIAQLLPERFALHQNFPNPFNPETNIKYDLPEMSNVRLEIFNILGQNVCTLVDGIESAGFKSVVWNGKNDSGAQVSSGIYLYKIVAKGNNTGRDFVKSNKMLLLQ